MVSERDKWNERDPAAGGRSDETTGEVPGETGANEEELVAAGGAAEPLEAIDDPEGAAESGEERLDAPAEVRVSREEKRAAAEGIMVKYCIFCKETILADSLACKYCGHVVHVFEGGVFKQLWWFFWAGVITLIGTLLPFRTGADQAMLSAFETFPGACYLIFSVLLVFAMAFNIYSRRLIMGPVFLMFVPAVHCWWTVADAVGRMPGEWWSYLYKIDALNRLAGEVGSGLMLILLGSTIASLTFILSLATAVAGAGKGSGSGAKGAAKQKRGGRGKGRS